MNNVTIIILGATGDLARKKIIPALYRLIHAKKLQNYLIIGVGRESTNAQELLDSVRASNAITDIESWQSLVDHFVYQKADLTNSADMQALSAYVSSHEKSNKLIGNRIIYCALAASLYCIATEHCAKSGLAKRTDKYDKFWHRIVYEKPFGNDLASAQMINQCIANNFNEHQIYRIDHYLLKEFVSNIALVRFTNIVFEPLWNNRYISSVQIILSETIGIGTRGAYYDAYGAVNDVMQNHMLEIMALIAMEAPEKLTGEYIRNERAKVLSAVKVIDALYGQYENYQQEPYVKPNSMTETFAITLMRINNPRWAGVPFVLKTGKYLNKKETSIQIKFKNVECLLARNCPSEPNYLTITISPESIMTLTLNVKKPGLSTDVMPVPMEFSHTKLLGATTPEAYEILFEEIIRGEESVSVRFDEIEQLWRIVDQMRTLHPRVHQYQKGTEGPPEVHDWTRKHGIRIKT